MTTPTPSEIVCGFYTRGIDEGYAVFDAVFNLEQSVLRGSEAYKECLLSLEGKPVNSTPSHKFLRGCGQRLDDGVTWQILEVACDRHRSAWVNSLRETELAGVMEDLEETILEVLEGKSEVVCLVAMAKQMRFCVESKICPLMEVLRAVKYMVRLIVGLSILYGANKCPCQEVDEVQEDATNKRPRQEVDEVQEDATTKRPRQEVDEVQEDATNI